MLAEIKEYLMAAAPDIVYVSGHGETTTYPGWQEICQDWIDSGLPLHIISHLGREFAEKEIDVLSRFTEITTSVDSHREEVHNRLRKGIPLSMILKNMQRIRDCARSRGEHPPAFAWDCVLSDRNIFALPDYLSFGLRHEVRRFIFCNLVKYPGMKEEIRHISELPLPRLPQVLTILEYAKTFLKEQGIPVHIDAGLIDAVSARLQKEACSGEKPPVRSQESLVSDDTDSWNSRVVFTSDQASDKTRFCYEPWIMLFVQASGEVQPCLFSRKSVGSLNTNSVEEILSGEEMQRYREGLSSGRLLEECRRCNQKDWISREDFHRYQQEWVREE